MRDNFFVRVGALALIAIISHLPALSGEFLWDDDAISTNPVFHSTSGIVRLWTEPGVIPLEQHYWPVTYTSFWLDAQLWGLEPFAMHVTNLALHVLNCLLLWSLFTRLKLKGAWWIAAIFAAHPVHVESVGWIIERKDVLSAALYLTAAHAVLRFDREGEAGRASRGPAIAALGIFVLAAWAKSVALSLPIVLAILLWARDGRLRKRSSLMLGAMLVLGIGLAAFDLSRSTSLDSLEDLPWSLGERVAIAGRALSFYAHSLLLPLELTPVVPRFEPGSLWVHALAWPALVLGLWVVRQKLGRFPLALTMAWGITLAPMLGLIEFSWMRHSFVADRFQYLASAFSIALLVIALERALRSRSEFVKNGLATLVVASLALLSYRHSKVFSSARSHAERIIASNPEAWIGHFNLGQEFRREGELEAALEAYGRSLLVHPDHASAHNNRGDILMSLNRGIEAELALRKALELAEELPTAHSNLGLLLTRRGDWEQARVHLERAVELKPGLAAFRVNLGLLFAKSGQLDEAQASFERALELESGNAIALQSLATIQKLREAR